MPELRREGAVVATSSSELAPSAQPASDATQALVHAKRRRELTASQKAEILNFAKMHKKQDVLARYPEISENTLKLEGK